jgi:hypothetical protein
MDFSLKTKHLKDSSKLTLTVDGPKNVIDRIEASIHDALSNRTISLDDTIPLKAHFEEIKPGEIESL